MPVLDRTAASLEPCGLQRLLPQTAKAAAAASTATERRSRTLHPTFWQYGVADLELSQTCQSLVAASSSPVPQTEPLNASSFLLDFLYPNGALRFLKSSYLRVLGDRRPAAVIRRPSRPYSSLPFSTPEPDATSQTIDSITTNLAGPSFPVEARKAAATTTSRGRADDDEASLVQELEDVLQTSVTLYSTEAFDRAWDVYSRLPFGAHKAELAHRVLLFLTPSRRPTEAQRIVMAFSAIDTAERDAAAVSHTIRALLRLNDREGALALFRQGLAAGETITATTATTKTTTRSKQPCPPGLGPLVADCLQRAAWDMLADVWAIYKEKVGRSEVEAVELKEVLEVANLQNRLEQLSAVVRQNMEAAATATTEGEVPRSVTGIFAAVVLASLHRLTCADSIPFVRQLKNVWIYEAFIHVALNNGQKAEASEAYGEYRQLRLFRPRRATLARLVQEAYYPDDVRGMESVLKDWYRVHGRPSYWGLQKFMAFYAGRGDVTSVNRLWNDFSAAHPGALERGEDTFAHLLKVHAVRGDIEQLEQVFGEITTVHHQTANTTCWNIRLHAHVERGRFGEAMRVFEQLCAAVEPDGYSFGTIMSLAGGRGDLELVLELHAAAEARGLAVTEAMLDPIVEAYCQNERLDEAERLCVSTARSSGEKTDSAQKGTLKKRPPQSYTALWNTLLRHHAFRHDLVSVNRVLKRMSRLAVAYDGGTYSALLFALAQCRQPRRAVELLRAAQDEGLFRPTAQHYTLLMMAYVRSRQPHRALQVNRLMHHLGFRRTSRQTQLVIKAFSQWQEFPPGVDANGLPAADGSTTSLDRRELLAKALREFQRSLAPLPSDGDRGPATVDAVRLPLGATRRFSFVIFMLVQARDFVGVEEVVQLYRSLSPPDDRQQPLPLKLCNALMLSDFYEGRFDRVKETWRYVLDRTVEIGRPHDWSTTNARSHSPIVARLRYGLTDPLKTMQRLYTAEGDADGLVRTIQEVLAAGFALDSKNWNHYVQNLARLGRTHDAFAVCEQHLMGQWSGFAVLRARRRGGGLDGDGVGGVNDVDRDGLHNAQFDGDLFRSDDVTTSQLLAAARAAEATTAAPARPPNNNSNTNSGSARLSRAQQLLEGAPRYNRPMALTFMVLAKAYMDLERSAPWSSAAERHFHDLAIRYPKAVHAVRTMVRMNSRLEGRAFGDGDPSETPNGHEHGLYFDHDDDDPLDLSAVHGA
ncbi:translation regulator [Grosmannia clavigera kw1407]|uniref:Translation regulator n=1 Tax=Grosmannia clavigera (strain kw1407 / UAMH 11150) TaxID=655863 RepID=F0XUL7_GROCL|nr:translation regulator [Grosmannia clavigera kw1407]EFW98995.1 translation regulator [Grosmannia clavigera kw1407]